MKLVIASLLCAAASIAHADPTASYVEAGVTVGGDHELYGALTASGGVYLKGPLWAHAMIAKGGASGVDEVTYASDYFAVRAGVESRTCAWAGAACVVAGVDLGYRREMLMAEYDHSANANAIVVPRAGLDLGGARLRVRPSLELSRDSSNQTGLGLGLGVAYRF